MLECTENIPQIDRLVQSTGEFDPPWKNTGETSLRTWYFRVPFLPFFPPIFMKKYLAILASLMVLSACAGVGIQKDDEIDDTRESEGVTESDEDNAEKLDGTQSQDDGTVKGNTTEDAGGDGQGGASVDVEAGVDVEVRAPRIIKVTADTWIFSPATITAKKGEKVTLQITGVNGTHGFMVPDLGLNATIAAGQTTTVTLPTDKTGTFAGSCSIPCGQGHKDMRVTVIISE